MTEVADAVAAAARALVGVRFRPQGRDPAFGLDCVGLVVAALGEAGVAIDPPRDYPQRSADPAIATALADRAGLARVPTAAAGCGDIVLLEAGPAQLHLAVLATNGFVHADAALRRVVEVPGRPGWPMLAAWRVPTGAQ